MITGLRLRVIGTETVGLPRIRSEGMANYNAGMVGILCFDNHKHRNFGFQISIDDLLPVLTFLDALRSPGPVVDDRLKSHFADSDTDLFNAEPFAGNLSFSSPQWVCYLSKVCPGQRLAVVLGDCR